MDFCSIFSISVWLICLSLNITTHLVKKKINKNTTLYALVLEYNFKILVLNHHKTRNWNTVLLKYAWSRFCKWTTSLTNVAHLCGEGASGWKAQISPSSTPSRLPLTVAGTPGDCPGKNHFAKGNFSQTILGTERRTMWRFPPRSQNKKRIWIPGPSCWTRCLTVDQLDRCRVGDGDHWGLLCKGSVKLQTSSSLSECASFKVWFTH